jgi:hypothetical protein
MGDDQPLSLPHGPHEGWQHSSDYVRHIVRITDGALVVLIGQDLDGLVGYVHVLDDGLDNGRLLEQASIEIETIASLRLSIIHAAPRVIVIRQGPQDVEAFGQEGPILQMAVRMRFKLAVIIGLEHWGTFEIDGLINDIKNAHLRCSRQPSARFLRGVFVHGPHPPLSPIAPM